MRDLRVLSYLNSHTLITFHANCVEVDNLIWINGMFLTLQGLQTQQKCSAIHVLTNNNNNLVHFYVKILNKLNLLFHRCRFLEHVYCSCSSQHPLHDKRWSKSYLCFCLDNSYVLFPADSNHNKNIPFGLLAAFSNTLASNSLSEKLPSRDCAITTRTTGAI